MLSITLIHVLNQCLLLLLLVVRYMAVLSRHDRLPDCLVWNLLLQP